MKTKITTKSLCCHVSSSFLSSSLFCLVLLLLTELDTSKCNSIEAKESYDVEAKSCSHIVSEGNGVIPEATDIMSKVEKCFEDRTSATIDNNNYLNNSFDPTSCNKQRSISTNDETLIIDQKTSLSGDPAKKSSTAINSTKIEKSGAVRHSSPSSCGIWLAKSSIPGAGLGAFAGKGFQRGDLLMDTGDIVVPLIHLNDHFNNGDDEYFNTFEDYSWQASAAHMDNEIDESYGVASLGLGSPVNSIQDFQNLVEEIPQHVTLTVHRSVNVSSGAFAYYQQRLATAKTNIKAGHELFANYGKGWFGDRLKSIGPIPLRGHHKMAERFYQLYTLRITKRYPPKISNDIWDAFIQDNAWVDTSRILFALPKQSEDLERLQKEFKYSLLHWKREQLSHPIDKLQEIGVCADHLTHGVSTLEHAGNGAFSKRFLPKNSIVAPVPLLHVPYKHVLNITQTGKYQLIVNYMIGHANSTLLLLPYSPVVGLINHNQTLANVRLQWADPKKSNHHPELLEKPISYLDTMVPSSKLAFELVATRDINPGEEILLDYGDSWEEAWQNHVVTWEPHPDIDYISAASLTSIYQSNTSMIFAKQDIPSNIMLHFNKAFEDPNWIFEKDLITYRRLSKAKTIPVHKILDFTVNKRSGRVLYNIQVAIQHKNNDSSKNQSNDHQVRTISKVPREAFEFFDAPYTSDLHLQNAFRHEIHIPDDIFPKDWKNNGYSF